MLKQSIVTFVVLLSAVSAVAQTAEDTHGEALRDAAMELHSCLNEDAKLIRVNLIFENGHGLIVAEFEFVEACEEEVMIACNVDGAEKLSNCMPLGISIYKKLFGTFESESIPGSNRPYDAPADSQGSTTLQLLLEEMSAPVTDAE